MTAHAHDWQQDDAPVCPGPECPLCTGEACALCGAGASASGPCDHDVLGRHTTPSGERLPRPHTHDWQQDDAASDIYTARYRCECGARGYRERRRNLPGTRAQHGVLPPRPIKEYAFDGKQYHARFPEERPAVDCKPRSAGRNITGGYLPPCSGGGR